MKVRTGGPMNRSYLGKGLTHKDIQPCCVLSPLEYCKWFKPDGVL